MRRLVTPLLLLLMAMALPLAAATRTVDRNNVACNDATGNPYCTIEAAIDDAVNGDVIDVVAGVLDYDESVIIDGESLTISSDDSPAPVIEAADYGGDSYSVITIWPNYNWCILPEEDIALPPRSRTATSAPTVTLQGLRLTGGDARGNSRIRINGDDAIVLRKNTVGDESVFETVVDSIGDTDTDPGNEWGTGATSTNRANLIRKSTDCSADTITTDAYDPSVDYAGTAMHHTNATLGAPIAVADFGTHTSSCTPTDVLFTQYVESYGWRMGIELWNGTAGSIDLSSYRLEVYENGNSCPSQIWDLSGTMTSGLVLMFSNGDSGLTSTLSASNFEGGSFDGDGGGGVWNHWATVTLNGMEIDNNFGYGGGVGNFFGTVTINESNIHDNTGDRAGGGILSEWGTLTVNDSQVSDNADDCNWECGGGVSVLGGTAGINGSVIDGNYSDHHGGGIGSTSGADITITDTAITNNESNETGGGIGSDNSNFTLVRSLVAGNVNNGITTNGHNDEENGGGIFSDHFGMLTVTNTTISGNSTPNSFGGGIHLLGRAVLEHVTLYDNTAGEEGSQIYVDAMAYDDDGANLGGPNSPIPSPDEDDDDESGSDYPRQDNRWCVPSCYIGTGTVTFRNTVIAEPDAATTDDPCAGGGAYISLGYNVVYPTDADCGADEPTDINGTDPQLEALADNGGPTETHAFPTTSPLFDGGTETETDDQRGEPRPQGETSDVGALELDAPTIRGEKSVSGTFTPGGSITYTIVLTNEGNVAQQDNAGDEFVDVVPSQLTVTTVSATSGTDAHVGNTVTWNGSIAAGASVTITINATVNPGASGTISNQGTINYDPDNDGDNDASIGTGSPGGAGPTIFNLGALAAEIPTASTLALALMALALGVAAVVALRLRG